MDMCQKKWLTRKVKCDRMKTIGARIDLFRISVQYYKKEQKDKTMSKRFFTAVIAAVLLTSCLSGCGEITESKTEISSSQDESSASQDESNPSQEESGSVPETSAVSEADFTTDFHVELGGMMITSYTGNAEVIEFPSEIGGNLIQMIANKSCIETYTPKCEYPSIKAAIIPNSVSDIDGYAFYNCTNLTSVTFGENVYWVSTEAFSGCTNLAEVIINDNIYHIEPDAFKDCTNLTNVTYKGKTYTSANINELIQTING